MEKPKMTKECYISFEIAELLRDTDFDGHCYHIWSVKEGEEPRFLPSSCLEDGVSLSKETLLDIERYDNEYDGQNVKYYLAPTQAMVLRWLREDKGIYVDVFIDDDSEMPWVYNVHEKAKEGGTDCVCHHNGEFFPLSDGYEQAVEAGIIHVIRDLEVSSKNNEQ